MENPEVTRRLEASLSDRHKEFARLYSRARKSLKRGVVHDLRTSSRRLIEALELFDALETPANLQKACTELKELQHSMRKLRDLQVEQRQLAAETKTPGVDTLVGELKSEEKAEKRRVKEALRAFNSKKVAREVRTLVDYLENSAEIEPTFEDDLRELASHHLRARFRDVALAIRAVPAKSPPPLALHEVRIRFKHFRYAWELVAPYLRNSDESQSLMKDFQTLLGDIQDVHVLLSSVVQSARRELNPYARSLAKKQQGLIGKFRETCPTVLSTFKAPLSAGIQVRVT